MYAEICNFVPVFLIHFQQNFVSDAKSDDPSAQGDKIDANFRIWVRVARYIRYIRVPTIQI
jgi:hypothetical protein